MEGLAQDSLTPHGMGTSEGPVPGASTLSQAPNKSLGSDQPPTPSTEPRCARSSTLAFDKWVAILLIVVNVMWFRWQLQLEHHLAARMVVSLLMLASSTVQLVWLQAAPESYLKHRSQVLLVCRLIRLGTAWSLADMSTCNTAAIDPAGQQRSYTAMLESTSVLPTALSSLLTCMVATTSVTTLFYSTLMPLPFWQQTALQLAYFLLLVGCGLYRSTVNQLPNLVPPQHLTDTCQALSNMFAAVASVQLGPLAGGSGGSEPSCEAHAAEVLVAFVVVLVGVLVPLRVAFKVGAHRKQAAGQLKRLLLQQLDHPQGQQLVDHPQLRRQREMGELDLAAEDMAACSVAWDAACAYELLVLWVMAVASWILALIASIYLPVTSE